MTADPGLPVPEVFDVLIVPNPSGRARRRVSQWGTCLLVIFCCLSASGCVRRRLTIRSNPPGAMVYIDKQEVGLTPVSVPYIYYGVREIQLVKDNFETLTVRQNFAPPWYQVPPLDFASENLWPRELRDERELEFALVPRQEVPDQLLRQRAEELRARTRQGLIAPLPPPPAVPAIRPLPSPLGGPQVPASVPSPSAGSGFSGGPGAGGPGYLGRIPGPVQRQQAGFPPSGPAGGSVPRLDDERWSGGSGRPTAAADGAGPRRLPAVR